MTIKFRVGRFIIPWSVVVLVAFLFIPLLKPSQYVLHVFLMIFLYGSLTLSWHLLSGYTGYLSFGHVVFFGIGAYASGISIELHKLPIPVAVLAGGAVAALVGAVLGYSCLRLRGHYFAIATLMLVFIGYVIFANISDFITKLRMEIWLPVLPYEIYAYRLFFYYVFLGLMLAIVGVSFLIERSKFGYGLLSIKEDEDIATTMGVNTTKLKTIAATLSAFFAGVTGTIYAQYISYIDPVIYFDVMMTFIVVYISFLGGLGTWIGPLTGAILFVPLNEALTLYFSPEVARIIFGASFVAIVLFLPKGIVGKR
jgi:branched-chain amino acid transport system permease protein